MTNENMQSQKVTLTLDLQEIKQFLAMNREIMDNAEFFSTVNCYHHKNLGILLILQYSLEISDEYQLLCQLEKECFARNVLKNNS